MLTFIVFLETIFWKMVVIVLWKKRGEKEDVWDWNYKRDRWLTLWSHLSKLHESRGCRLWKFVESFFTVPRLESTDHPEGAPMDMPRVCWTSFAQIILQKFNIQSLRIKMHTLFFFFFFFILCQPEAKSCERCKWIKRSSRFSNFMFTKINTVWP